MLKFLNAEENSNVAFYQQAVLSARILLMHHALLIQHSSFKIQHLFYRFPGRDCFVKQRRALAEFGHIFITRRHDSRPHFGLMIQRN